MQYQKFIVFTITLVVSISIFAQSEFSLNEIRKKHFRLNSDGVAIDGFDPVSYFSNNPIKGKKEISKEYQGIIYYFSSIENKKIFEQNPDQFEPKYGGWCAYAMGESGDKVEIDPKRFKIIDGKINLFYDGIFGDTLIPWNQNEKKLIPKANENWKKLMK
ncbi:YHS domain-containing protein [Leptospira bouyouniensis]|uniref:YHS domain-containing protein n=1 Tax=Leptospira bouyouniensis TaxID=2484911 RepID=A0A7I0IJ79_9LEPT|nr:YHS domain-containing (seleno)protein [Leptospira bouyouniensis]TGL03168.1 YHS domain-containing protein [Leptospira bouyouniensis]